MNENPLLQEVASAKINLFLHVCGRRDNGYHELDSLMVFADYGDVITVQSADDLSLTLIGPMAGDLSAGEDNLILRAAQGLQALSSVTQGATITLEKNLPIAAGIGGGSADAAATLRVLCRLWDISPPEADLQALALSLGADVPVCLRNRAAHVTGIGEGLTPTQDLPDCWVLLVNPREAVSTPAIFKARQGSFSAAAPLLAEDYQSFDHFIAALDSRHNDLSPPAQMLCPVIDRVLAKIHGLPNCALARMSGSGATCFGLFSSQESAIKAQQTLEKETKSWWSAVGKIF